MIFLVGVRRNNGVVDAYNLIDINIKAAVQNRTLVSTSGFMCKLVTPASVLGLLKQGGTLVGAELDSYGQITGSNGSIDRYGDLNAKINSPLVVLARYSLNSEPKYCVANAQGKVFNVNEAEAVQYAQKYGIANGKIENKNGTVFISAIKGEYIAIELDTSKLQAELDARKADSESAPASANVTATPVASAIQKTAQSIAQPLVQSAAQSLVQQAAEEQDSNNNNNNNNNNNDADVKGPADFADSPDTFRRIPTNLAKSRPDFNDPKWKDKEGLTVNQKLTYTIRLLLKMNPFIHAILVSMRDIVPCEPDNKYINTMAVSPFTMTLYYNIEFVSKLPIPELLFVIIHEMYHILYKHGIRMDNRDKMIWNVATDLFINRRLVEQFHIPHEKMVTLNPITGEDVEIEGPSSVKLVTRDEGNEFAMDTFNPYDAGGKFILPPYGDSIKWPAWSLYPFDNEFDTSQVTPEQIYDGIMQQLNMMMQSMGGNSGEGDSREQSSESGSGSGGHSDKHDDGDQDQDQQQGGGSGQQDDKDQQQSSGSGQQNGQDQNQQNGQGQGQSQHNQQNGQQGDQNQQQGGGSGQQGDQNSQDQQNGGGSGQQGDQNDQNQQNGGGSGQQGDQDSQDQQQGGGSGRQGDQDQQQGGGSGQQGDQNQQQGGGSGQQGDQNNQDQQNGGNGQQSGQNQQNGNSGDSSGSQGDQNGQQNSSQGGNSGQDGNSQGNQNGQNEHGDQSNGGSQSSGARGQGDSGDDTPYNRNREEIKNYLREKYGDSALDRDIVNDTEKSENMNHRELNEQAESNLKRTISSATTALNLRNIKERGYGVDPYIQRIIDEIIRPRINWVSLLRNKLNLEAGKVTTWMRPGKRGEITPGIMFPGKKKDDPTGLSAVAALDTSGSVGVKELGFAFGAIVSLCTKYKVDLEVITWNGDVTGSWRVTDVKDLRGIVPDSGGTEIDKMFEYVKSNKKRPDIMGNNAGDGPNRKKRKVDVLLIITDGMIGDDYAQYENVAKHTIWIINDLDDGWRDFKPLFGTVAPIMPTRDID